MASPNWFPVFAATMLAVPSLEAVVWPVAILVTLLASGGIALWLSPHRLVPVRAMRSRFVYGVPWGSIVVICLVLAIYLFVQNGYRDLTRPVFLPYVNWSYLYPTGVILSPFAHASLSHLLSNLVTALVLAPLAEYIYGHHPEDDPWRIERPIRHHPVVRAVVIFPAVVVGLALVSSLFAWGPVIGFSGVVFAFAGFTVVKYPIITIIAITGRSAFAQVGDALFNPVVIAEIERTVSEPGWVGVSFQGHALGFLIGVVIAISLLQHRRSSEPAEPLRLWFGITVIGLVLSLWAIWFGLGNDTYVLLQGLGVVLVFIGAALVVLAASASNRVLWGTVTRRQATLALLVVPLVVIAAVGIPMNAWMVVDYEEPANAVSVGDYDVFYGTNAEAPLRPAISLFGDTSPGSGSGLIVMSEDRHLWTVAMSASEVERSGEGTIRLGGLGWHDDIRIERYGWTPVGNESVYRIELVRDGTTSTGYTSAGRFADLVIDGQRFGLDVGGGEFLAVVRDADGERYEASLPDSNESTTVGNLTVHRGNETLEVRYRETRVTVAERE